eukprot:4321604-Karenia_brevis.AAC.1
MPVDVFVSILLYPHHSPTPEIQESDQEVKRRPPGFGACGAPNDGLHGDLHRIRGDREKMFVGWGDNLMDRDHGATLGVANDGQRRP